MSVNGDTTEATGPSDTSEATEPAVTPEAPEATHAEHPEPQAERLTAEQLCDYVARASFATTLGRRGYQQPEVDALLVKVTETLREGEPVADLVRRTQLPTVRLEDGYETAQVDDFLAAVIDLDPNAEAAQRPEVGRSGLITKLFG